jgi:hypothetical protein
MLVGDETYYTHKHTHTPKILVSEYHTVTVRNVCEVRINFILVLQLFVYINIKGYSCIAYMHFIDSFIIINDIFTLHNQPKNDKWDVFIKRKQLHSLTHSLSLVMMCDDIIVATKPYHSKQN